MIRRTNQSDYISFKNEARRRFKEMARFGGGSYSKWEKLFGESLDYISDGVEDLIDSLQLVTDNDPYDCLKEAASGVEDVVNFIIDYGAEDFYKKGFCDFDEVSIRTRNERGFLYVDVKLRVTLGNLQERINKSVETGSGSKSTKELVWYSFTSCRSNRNSDADNTAEFVVDLSIRTTL